MIPGRAAAETLISLAQTQELPKREGRNRQENRTQPR